MSLIRVSPLSCHLLLCESCHCMSSSCLSARRSLAFATRSRAFPSFAHAAYSSASRVRAPCHHGSTWVEFSSRSKSPSSSGSSHTDPTARLSAFESAILLILSASMIALRVSASIATQGGSRFSSFTERSGRIDLHVTFGALPLRPHLLGRVPQTSASSLSARSAHAA